MEHSLCVSCDNYNFVCIIGSWYGNPDLFLVLQGRDPVIMQHDPSWSWEFVLSYQQLPGEKLSSQSKRPCALNKKLIKTKMQRNRKPTSWLSVIGASKASKQVNRSQTMQLAGGVQSQVSRTFSAGIDKGGLSFKLNQSWDKLEEPLPCHPRKSSPMPVFLPPVISEGVLSLPALLPFYPTAIGENHYYFERK